MKNWIEGFVPDGSLRIVKAPRKVWAINIHQKYFTNVVLELVVLFADFLCKVCSKNHNTKSGLISCLQFHRGDTVNYYLDLISEVSYHE